MMLLMLIKNAFASLRKFSIKSFLNFTKKNSFNMWKITMNSIFILEFLSTFPSMRKNRDGKSEKTETPQYADDEMKKSRWVMNALFVFGYMWKNPQNKHSAALSNKKEHFREKSYDVKLEKPTCVQRKAREKRALKMKNLIDLCPGRRKKRDRMFANSLQHHSIYISQKPAFIRQ